MKIIVIGNGISGLTAAIKLAKENHHVLLVAPFSPYRSQSIMAAGGINACLNETNDSPLKHRIDTLKGGCFIENEEAVKGLTENAPTIVRWLEQIGVQFTRNEELNLKQRKLGGHSEARSLYAGTSTGKQIITALVRECLKEEKRGYIEQKTGYYFYKALIQEGACYGVLLLNQETNHLELETADATIFATGGQNKLYGKTTGSTLCDGYAIARLFTQGVYLRNLEFIQYHPTSIETEHKKMLISEGARSGGGRLFVYDGKKKVYFLEEKYGQDGNLMPRDIVSREIAKQESQVYLDISFLDDKTIHESLGEIEMICKDYIGLDVKKEPIPVSPCIHFFMGGLKVNNQHETNISHLYAIGECASKYHGANRLGGNSLLAALYSADIVSRTIQEKSGINKTIDFTTELIEEEQLIKKLCETESLFPSVYLERELATIMNSKLGIVRCEKELKEGLEEIDFHLNVLSSLKFDPTISVYQNIRLKYLFILAKATLLSALERKESRGAHFRSDYTETIDAYKKASIASFSEEKIKIEMEEDDDSQN